jgi:hypothetical protein
MSSALTATGRSSWTAGRVQHGAVGHGARVRARRRLRERHRPAARARKARQQDLRHQRPAAAVPIPEAAARDGQVRQHQLPAPA